jgi:DNA-binding MarR family transcriptional regulator
MITSMASKAPTGSRPIDPESGSLAELEVTEFAGQLFFRLWRASHTRVGEELAAIDLTPALFAILNFLRAREGTIQQEIGSAMGIDPSTMVALIDQLEDAGLAKRRPRPTDRRAREVVITAKGHRMLERGRQIAMEVEDEVLRGLTATERAQLLALLRRALSAAPPQALWNAGEGD